MEFASRNASSVLFFRILISTLLKKSFAAGLRSQAIQARDSSLSKAFSVWMETSPRSPISPPWQHDLARNLLSTKRTPPESVVRMERAASQRPGCLAGRFRHGAYLRKGARGVGSVLVCGSGALRRLLINRARTFIFSTALPPYFAAQVAAGRRLAADAATERAHLARLGRW